LTIDDGKQNRVRFGARHDDVIARSSADTTR